MQFTYLTTTMDDGIYMGLDKSQRNISGTSVHKVHLKLAPHEGQTRVKSDH